ncbi:uncharacterized LOC118069372 precursor [Chelonus insularis]|uniref:uncharacterized LOC118069372 precursor n=1 Tax=Chelonus insularis TaxID=460826 RepID=UPI001588E42F|nr:uncharacterized LOC118069372 precursor [Chelonus insularis]KAG8148341.1 putative envelope protein odv-e66-3 [Chelonus insularis]
MSKGLIATIIVCLCIVVLAVVLKPIIYPEVSSPSEVNSILRRSVSDSDATNLPKNLPENLAIPDPIVSNVKQTIVADDSFTKQNLESEEFEKLLSQYKPNSQVQLPNTLKSWQTSFYVFQDLCNFGYQLLQLYETTNHTDKIYETIAAALIQEIGEALKDYQSDSKEAFGFSRTWIYDMTYLAKFLIAYEYIGNNEDIKHSICHPLLTKMVPSINKGADVEISPQDVLSLHFGVIRLSTNYLYYRTSYNNDLDKINQLKAISSLNITINDSDNIEEGVYRDDSCIKSPNVASYEYFRQLYTCPNYIFYSNMCRVIGPDTGNLPTVIETIFRKILHPQINYAPFGLFDTDGSIRNLNWWNIQGALGVFIFPLIGLGVFKNNEVMFSVRVQRPNIAACMIDRERKGDYILGSIQLRRIYQVNRTYPTELKWSQLSKEPGIISVIGERGSMYYKNQLVIDSNTYSCSDVDQNNLIGRLPNNENVMFWFNKYKCNLIQCTVTEIGLMTNNGLETEFIIHNYGSFDVQLRVDDDPPSDFDRKLTCISNEKNEQGFVVIPSSETQRITWAMVFNHRRTSKLIYDGKMKTFKFNYASKLYSVILKENSQYIVKIGNSGNIFGGSSSSNPDDSMTLDGLKPMKRNPETLMYT